MPYDLYLTQTWRGKDSEGKVLPLHWALTVKISGTDDEPVGNLYNAAGNIDTFFYERLTGISLRNPNWRGSLLVCTFPEDQLLVLEEIMSETPVIRLDYNWNCQNWVWTSLRGLRHAGFEVRPNMTWAGLRTEMDALLEAWENGDI